MKSKNGVGGEANEKAVKCPNLSFYGDMKATWIGKIIGQHSRIA